MDGRQIATVRAFARTTTARLGVLDEHWQGRGRPLGQSRLLFELRAGPVALTTLRARLGLDSGYASRMVHALAEDGLVLVASDPTDGRARTVGLTDAGRAEVIALDRLSDTFAEELVGPLDVRRRTALVAAMADVTRLLDAAAVDVREVDPFDPLVEEAHAAYFAELAARFAAGFDPGDTSTELPRYRAPAGSCLVALLDGELVGTVALAPLPPAGPDDDVATPLREVKRMWVAPSGRGLGIGRRLLAEVEDRARALGTATLRLDTNEVLTTAIALYRSAGYRDVPRYNDNPSATHFFELDLRPTDD